MLAELASLETIYGYEGICLVYRGADLIGSSTGNWIDEGGPHADLYQEANMALAWEMVRLVLKELPASATAEFESWWRDIQNPFKFSSHSIQVRWLDRLLELALESNRIAPPELSLAF